MATVDPEIKALQNEIFWSKVQRAREQSPWEKFLDGARLFDMASRVTVAGIRSQFPSYTAKQVHEEFLRRLEIGRRLSERGNYSNANDG
jgi:hypothetical protein